MTWVKHSARFLLVTIGIILLTSFTIDATDALRGSQTALSIFTKEALTGDCAEGMVRLDMAAGGLCVDAFENSPGSDCSHASPNSPQQTEENLSTLSCNAVSAPDVIPWRFVTFTQAQQLCARNGKRLPTNEEWHAVSSGLIADDCVIESDSGQPELTGSADCRTAAGTHDMVGNVWEWVDGEVKDGLYDGRIVPVEGYVVNVDQNGVVLETDRQPESTYGNDYAWTNDSGVRAMARGGFYGSGEDAGIFAQNLSLTPDFSAAGVGFRCVTGL